MGALYQLLFVWSVLLLALAPQRAASSEASLRAIELAEFGYELEAPSHVGSFTSTEGAFDAMECLCAFDEADSSVVLVTDDA